MKYKIFLPLILVWGLYSFAANSQINANSLMESEQCDKSIPQFITTGVEYLNPNPQAEGNPFLFNEVFINSDLYFRGTYINDVLMNYDVFNQSFVLNYKNVLGGEVRVILPQEYIDSVYLGDLLFIAVDLDSANTRYFNVFAESGERKIMIAYKKLYQISSGPSQSSYHFSDLIQTYFLMEKGKLYKINRIGHIRKYLSEEENARFKTFIKGHRLRLRKSTPEEFKQLLQYINN
ncbi:hypothetical protein ACE1ET_08955 [Saccharicrinis sp. FJH62]|uniref:hypothetical protein n=1 Tax=Saccharicrinis sp. FJH62 TaxID=3344657 RepID=UPI0035D42120